LRLPPTNVTEDEHSAAKTQDDARVVIPMTDGADKQIAHDSDQGKILLVGDIKHAFLDAGALNSARYEICANTDEAIDAVAKNRFTAIAITISTIGAKPSAVLKDLKDRSDAKIILMAQMYEEPRAIQLVHSAYNGARLAEDYLICPVEPGTFYESVLTPDRSSPRRRLESERVRQSEIPIPVPAGSTIEARIRHLERLATEDDLTGLKNRRYIREFARQIVERAGCEDAQVTLLLFDIDNFKRYNDTCGHLKGDEILRQAAILMRRCCRVHDVVGRIGGDEFAVVFWDDPAAPGPQRQEDRRTARADHPAEAISVAKRFLKEFGKAELDQLGPEGQGILTISGGLASFPRDGASVEELLRRADMALLRAKRQGKNRIYLVGEAPSDIADLP